MLVFLNVISTESELKLYQAKQLEFAERALPGDNTELQNDFERQHGDLRLLIRKLDNDIEQVEALARGDFSAGILSVRITVPALRQTVKYSLASRLAGSGKPPVSLACRSFFMSSFESSFPWAYAEKPQKTLTFVSYATQAPPCPDSRYLLNRLVKDCATMSSPFPYFDVAADSHRHIVRDPKEDLRLLENFINWNRDALIKSESLAAYQGVLDSYSAGNVDSCNNLLVTAASLEGLGGG